MPTASESLSRDQDYVLGKIYALENRTVVSLFNEYRAAFDRMKSNLDAVWDEHVPGESWSAEDAAFRLRTETLLSQIAQEMAGLAQLSANITLDATESAWRAGSAGTAWSIDGILPLSDAAIPLLPSEIVRAQIIAPFAGSTLGDRFEDNRLEFERRMRRSLVQSQIEGEGMNAARKRLAAELGIELSGPAASQKTHRANFNRLTVLVRTEIIRASAMGAAATYRQNANVLRGWEWLTATDERVCPICAPLDGRIFDLNGKPIDGKGGTPLSMPPAHPQCRCSLAPALKDVELERRVTGRRIPFLQWAADRGLHQNVYGQAFDFRGARAPQPKRAA